MNKKVFLISTPFELFEKMKLEFDDFKNDPSSSRHAFNFTLTAYHLREWVWKSLLEPDRNISNKISADLDDQDKFNTFINDNCPEFKLLRELANNAKHFYSKSDQNNINKVHLPVTWDQIDCAWDKLEIPWDYNGLIAVTNDQRWISVLDLFSSVCKFWIDLFKKFEN